MMQLAHVNHLQLLAEFFTLKLCSLVEMGDEGQEVVMLNVIFFSPVTTQISTFA
jgi:hypothetical protein